VVLAAVATASVLTLRRVDFVWDLIQDKPFPHENITTIMLILGFNTLMVLFSRSRMRSERNRLVVDNYENTVQSLMDANLNLQEKTVNEIAEAINQERKRIIRDIHDIVGHGMVNIIMLSESMSDKIKAGNKQAEEIVQVIRNQAEMILHETEATLLAVKKFEIDRKYDIIAIKRLSTLFQKATGVKVTLELANIPFTFGRDLDRVVYRIIQECMTNAFRHGNATEIKIIFWKFTKYIEVKISDNGRGAKQINEGIGIWGIRERLTSIGGHLQLISSRSGFELLIRFPWTESSKNNG